jgi:CrcB protein
MEPGMNWLAVGIGAALGAWLRWGLGILLNAHLKTLPLGTLAANLGGGYLIGISVGFFLQHPDLPMAWRLFAVTGFLGGLTTFSTFSAESMLLLQKGDYMWAFVHILLHLAGSIAFCMAGFASYRAFGT